MSAARGEPASLAARTTAIELMADGDLEMLRASVMPAAGPGGDGVAQPDPSLDGDGTLEQLIANYARTLQSQTALLYELHGDGSPVIVCSWGADGPDELTRAMDGSAFIAHAGSLARASLEPLDASRDAKLVHDGTTPLRYAVAAPVQTHEGPDRLLVAAFSSLPADPARTVWAAERYASLLALHLSLPGALAGLLTVARTDSLTGCLTFDAIRHELGREMNRSARANLDLSVCFIDLDGFKRVNDEHGHLRGNDVLAVTGKAIREGLRSCDTVGRYGGDEFVAILPETRQSEAVRLAERLRSLIAQSTVPGLDRPLTASIGVAAWSAGLSAEQLLARADEAMLAAKSLGHRRQA